ncbi:ZZ-type zinc finger-containing protein 3 [Rhizophlyctis rosea]|uniref:ZZ-type zinc finger-containing protein 3 n=1 Tax=Rhizophlyctis rosea TaxID=64517 RepID=A0AAD5X5X5_9FUNG|nr:ZZ-type zinc finger-containing protein 3 [Rhizophlyctis rosea]
MSFEFPTDQAVATESIPVANQEIAQETDNPVTPAPISSAEVTNAAPKEPTATNATEASCSSEQGGVTPMQIDEGQESDALQKNEDYQLICSALTVLRNQLEQGAADLQRLISMRTQALDNPVEFVEDLLARRKLVSLLEIFPEEPVAQRRFEKIASAIGTRTARQVGSRVQKYFAELKAAGLPLPGRSSTSDMSITPVRTTGRISGAHYVNRNTGSRAPSGSKVVMSDDESDAEDGLGIPSELKATEEYKELVRLRTLAKVRAAHVIPSGHESDPVHRGFSCDSCSAEPIVGIRWKCLDCPYEMQVDLCDDCHGSGFVTEYHRPDHHFEKVVTPEPVPEDHDELPSGEYGYLGL